LPERNLDSRELVLRLLLPVSLLLTLLLAGCSGGDDDDAANDTDNGAATTDSSNDGGDDSETPDDSDSGEDDDGNSGGDDEASDFHACSLFTGAELSEALGVQLSDGRDYLAVAAGATNCTWEGDIVLFVEVLLEGGEAWYDAIHVPGVGTGEAEEVEGVGDVALYDSFLNTLDVVDGDRFISVQSIGGTRDNKEVAIQVAEMALERLP
jgi:hypothetical protein